MAKIIVKNAVKRKSRHLYYIDPKGNLVEEALPSAEEWKKAKEDVDTLCVQCEESKAEYVYFDNKYCEECLEEYYVENRMYENYSFDIFLTTDCKKFASLGLNEGGEQHE